METLAAGQRLDHYAILENLGQGSFSTAYKACDERSGELVVLKCPNPVILGDARSLSRFRREMSIARMLHHPHIQSSVDAGESRSVLYLALEYIDGTALSQILSERGRFEPDVSKGYALQLLSALTYAHGQGVIHRDLKPGNVLATSVGELKIIDFGIAYSANSRRLTWQWAGSALGTPSYMSPEQVQGKRGDVRSDLYALGAMLYEMLTGRPPFEGADIFAVMQQHLRKTPEAPARINKLVPPGLSGIVFEGAAEESRRALSVSRGDGRGLEPVRRAWCRGLQLRARDTA